MKGGKMYYRIRNLQYGFKNLIKWFPIIWKDRDWDYHFFYDMMRYKLNNMEKSIYNGMHIGCEKESKHIKICVNLLDRLIEDKYSDNAHEIHKKKWGKCNMSLNNGFMTFVYENDKNDEHKTERNKDLRKCIDQEEYMIEQDLNMLFDILKKRIRKWWD
jgi:hypothetical protein